MPANGILDLIRRLKGKRIGEEQQFTAGYEFQIRDFMDCKEG
jgi:hypothetical protein